MDYKSILFSIVIILVVCLPVHTQNLVSTENLDEFISSEMKRNNILGAGVVIVNRNGPIFLKGYGFKNSEQEKVLPTTRFDIGSLTKSFTAMAILQLESQDLIDLENEVTDYLPRFATKNQEYSAQIKIKHLLNHTSGFSTLQGNRMQVTGYNEPDALKVAVEDLKNVTLSCRAGKCSEYSNANYLILGRIIELITGEPYESYITKNIFNVIGMHNSSFEVHGDCAMPYRYILGFPVEYRYTNERDQVSAGGIISDPTDIGKYLNAILRRDTSLLPRYQYDKIFALMASESNKVGTYGWIRGHEKKESNEIGFLWHGGSAPGFQSVMILLPEQELALAVMTNTDGGEFGVKSSNTLVFGVLKNILGLPRSSSHRTMRIIFGVMWILPLFFLFRIFILVRNWTKPKGFTFIGILTLLSLIISYACLKLLPNSLGGAEIRTVYTYAPESGLLLILTSASFILWVALEWTRKITN